MGDRKQEIIHALNIINARLDRWPNDDAWKQDFQDALAQGEEAAYELLRFSGISEREAHAMANPKHPFYTTFHTHHSNPVAFARNARERIIGEARDMVIYRLEAQGYQRRDAQQAIQRASQNWSVEEIGEIYSTGMTEKMHADVISLLTELGALKKNDGKMEFPPP